MLLLIDKCENLDHLTSEFSNEYSWIFLSNDDDDDKNNIINVILPSFWKRHRDKSNVQDRQHGAVFEKQFTKKIPLLKQRQNWRSSALPQGTLDRNQVDIQLLCWSSSN